MSVISYGMNADSGRVADALIIHTAIWRQRTKASYSRLQPNNQSSHKQLLRPQMGARAVRVAGSAVTIFKGRSAAQPTKLSAVSS